MLNFSRYGNSIDRLLSWDKVILEVKINRDIDSAAMTTLWSTELLCHTFIKLLMLYIIKSYLNVNQIRS